MNTSIAFPAPKPELKLPPHAATPPSEEDRHRLEDDMEALREREANLRAYESHLRAWQEKIEQGQVADAAGHFAAPAPHRSPSTAPFASDPTLHAAWNKLIRARELLEAEQAHLRDDRLNLKETAANLKRREDALTLREARLTLREEQISAMVDASIVEHTKASALARFTQAPFAMAKSVFGAKPKAD
ncbi:MAG: hypothetical protein JWM32_831 [Verrucomicrobia bacterium]|nr:hypothetical protein [Verrucomicrobiota bacterium]